MVFTLCAVAASAADNGAASLPDALGAGFPARVIAIVP